MFVPLGFSMVTSDVQAWMVQLWLFGGHGGDAGLQRWWLRLQRWWLFGSNGVDDGGNGGYGFGGDGDQQGLSMFVDGLHLVSDFLSGPMLSLSMFVDRH